MRGQDSEADQLWPVTGMLVLLVPLLKGEMNEGHWRDPSHHA